MRIRRISVVDWVPIRSFEMTNLSSLVVVAGANGCGKTRLKEAIASTCRSPSSPQLSLTLEATRDQESAAWNGSTLEVRQGTACDALHRYMDSRSRGGTYVGTVIQIDSDRTVQPVKFQPITLATADPYDADINLTYYLSSFATRWPELVNKIYQKAATRDLKIARFARSNPTSLCQTGLDENPDPFIPYQQVFSRLLPSKTLEAIDPKRPSEFMYRTGDAGPFPFQTLSSGEQEVVKVAFDLIWKDIRHSVILIDEPELHLHPTLAFRLIETLKGLGGGTNQLILFTHSADLISTYYATGNVYFVDLDDQTGNQAKRLSDLGEGHSETARSVGANLGLFAVGKRLVFIEGADASVDRLTYHKVAQECFPEAYLLPTGSVKNINSLRDASAELERTIFGVNLFMVRDRDGLSDEQVTRLERNPRLRVLPRRHIENYFFDAEVLGKVGERFCQSAEKSRPEAIEEALLQSAGSCLHSAIVAAIKQNVVLNGAMDAPKAARANELSLEELTSILVRELKAASETVAGRFSSDEVERLVSEARADLSAALESERWKTIFPGKPVLARFVGDYWQEDVARVRQAYVEEALSSKPEALQDIRVILEHFRSLT